MSLQPSIYGSWTISMVTRMEIAPSFLHLECEQAAQWLHCNGSCPVDITYLGAHVPSRVGHWGAFPGHGRVIAFQTILVYDGAHIEEKW